MTPKDMPLQAVRDLLKSIDEDRSELVRERDNAAQVGNLDLVLQYSKDLRILHTEYLQAALKAAQISHSQTRQRSQYSGGQWSASQCSNGILEPQADDNRKRANEEEKARGSEAQFMDESFTTRPIGDEFLARIEGEKTFLKNLKKAAQHKGSVSLVRACRRELRQLGRNLLDGQMEISGFENQHPPSVDLRAKENEIWAWRFRVVEAIKIVAERSAYRSGTKIAPQNQSSVPRS